jgi:hypothetical protein
MPVDPLGTRSIFLLSQLRMGLPGTSAEPALRLRHWMMSVRRVHLVGNGVEASERQLIKNRVGIRWGYDGEGLEGVSRRQLE